MRLFQHKYIITLLASAALTFCFLCSKMSTDKINFFPAAGGIAKEDLPETSKSLSNNRSYMLRKSSQGNLVNSHRNLIPPSWVVLPGNITVHEGEEIVPFDFYFDINADKICDTFDNSRKKLIIFIPSTADHFSRREVIRETWGLKLLQIAYNFRIVFLLGKGETHKQSLILHEGYRYGDLVQINLTESFRNLGKKSVAGLQWSKLFCKNADFVIKTDDDILVHIPNVMLAVNDATNSNSLFLCHKNIEMNIVRKTLTDKAAMPSSFNKYEVSESELPGHYYPPYCSGLLYAFSNSVRDRLLEACQVTPIFFIEDAYLTGFCRHKAGIIITPHVGVTLRPPIDVNQAACIFKDGRITSQEVSPDELRHLWAELNTQDFKDSQDLLTEQLAVNEVSV